MTGKEIYHIVDSATPQNGNGSVKINIPTAAISLELLSEEEDRPVTWQHTDVALPGVASSDSHDTDESNDAAVPLPVLAKQEHFIAMWHAFVEDGEGKVEQRERDKGATTIPKAYTADATKKDHDRINFERDDRLVFFAPESLLKHAFEHVDVDGDEEVGEEQFERLYVCPEDEFKHLTQGHPKVYWNGPFPPASHSPAVEECLNVFIDHGPGKGSEYIAHPVSEGWVPLAELSEVTDEATDEKDDGPAGGSGGGPGGATGSSVGA